jgi:L-lactate utilization protein LutB
MVEKELKEIINIIAEVEEGKDVKVAKDEIQDILEDVFYRGRESMRDEYPNEFIDIRDKLVDIKDDFIRAIDEVIGDL